MYTAETIIRNVRVLATDQRYNAEDETGKTPVRTFSSVTLEATPEIAEKKMLAQAAARPTASRSSATTGGDVSRFWVPVRGRVRAPSSQPENKGGYAPSSEGRQTAAPTGPVVRVTRGDKMTEVPVGGK